MDNTSDIYSEQKRSEVMSKVKAKNTKPELQVRSWLHKRGYRYRLHLADLPGCPDIVSQKYKTIIFVHGCFWHQHQGCKKATIPQNNYDFWKVKLERNVVRDEKVFNSLMEQGWNIIVVWECDIKTDLEKTMQSVISKLVL
jgi:DNA mismatch endonuclease (patch repair protein)